MRSFVGLLKREWLEHRAAFLAGAGAVLALMLLAGMVALIVNSRAEVELSISQSHDLNEVVEQPDLENMGALEMLAAMAFDAAGSTDGELRQKMAKLQNGLAQPFHVVYLVLATFVLLSGLYDERKDHSILFWKSMPVSDAYTVASKVVFVLWVAPIVVILAILLVQVFALSLAAIYVENGMGGRIWSAAQIWLRPVEMLIRYFVLSIWLLPIAGWFMLISATAKRLPVLWAVGIPWVLTLLEQIFFGASNLGGLITQHLRILPVFTEQYSVFTPLSLFTGVHIWLALLLGLALLGATVYCRRRYNEL